MKRFFLVLLLALDHCGGGGGSGLELTVSAGETVLEASLRNFGTHHLALVGGEGEVEVLWSQPGEGFTLQLVGQTVRGRVPEGSHKNVSTDLRSAGNPTACRHENGLAIAWTDALPELPHGITLDESNVDATFAWPASNLTLRAHPNTIGRQRQPSIACLRDGDRVLAWHSFCGAVEVRGNTSIYFAPEECDDEPPHGNYLRFFDSTGTPLSAPIQIDAELYPWPLVAAAGSGFVVLSGTRLQSWQNGEISGEIEEAEAWSPDASLACTNTRCAAAGGGQALLFDAGDLGERQLVIFQETSYPAPDVTIRPRAATMACDIVGTCVVTWVLERETWDYDVVYIEPLGLFARAFNVETGRMGSAVMIHEPTDYEYESEARIASTGPGRFVIARAPGDDILLSMLLVE